jgi:hypothetical protein
MSDKSKLALAAAILAVSIVSPAFAQSFHKTGGQLPHYYGSSGAVIWGSWGPPAVASSGHSVMQRSGLHAFARIRRRSAFSGSGYGRATTKH